MKIHFHFEKTGNFGDDLNRWLWSRFFPSGFFNDDERTAFIGIGTLLGSGALAGTPKAERRIVFGSGSGYSAPVALDNTWDVRFVRGPRTAQAFGLPARLAVTDPAVLVHLIKGEFETTAPKVPAYFPHHSSLKLGDWEEICNQAGLKFIDARLSGPEVIKEILSSSVVLTEAMHGAIVADALRVPWIPVKSGSHILEYKWQDWAESVGMSVAFQDIGGIYRPLSKYPLGIQIKNEVKRLAKTVGINPQSVIRPLRGSSPREIEQTTNELRSIASSSGASLSTNNVMSEKLDQILGNVERLVKDYSRST